MKAMNIKTLQEAENDGLFHPKLPTIFYIRISKVTKQTSLSHMMKKNTKRKVSNGTTSAAFVIGKQKIYLQKVPLNNIQLEK
ncbi:hypothetical protein [Listeria monocytogenes]|uniref:hypothetical protein n=1 Tax=Listeria monocytogenes TaxID=1639 RepID=UPI00035919E2|nr:hypothetical protein M641_15385 [Listeria monocytogenes]